MVNPYPILKRREFLDRLGRMGGGVLAASTGLLIGCKSPVTSHPVPDRPEPQQPVEVKVSVRFYNHTQGFLAEKNYQGMSNSPLVVKISDCPHLASVDGSRIALREGIQNNWLGKFIEHSDRGETWRARFPRQDMQYDAFLMNATNGTDYNIIDKYANAAPWPGYGDLPHTPNATWDREDHDGGSGPDHIPREAVWHIKEASSFSWAKYMDFTELPAFQRGDFWAGYCVMPGKETKIGYSSNGMAAVNSSIIKDHNLLFRVFLQSIFGHLSLCYNTTDGANGNTQLYEYMTTNSGLNARGRDLLAYTPVTDPLYYNSP